jgi:hypothetical protein
MNVSDSIHSLLSYERFLFCCDSLGSYLRVGHFFGFRCPLVYIPQLNIQLLNSLTNQSIPNDGSLTTASFFSARLLIQATGNHGKCLLPQKLTYRKVG